MELNDEQLRIVDGLKKAAGKLKEKAENAEYEAIDMADHSYEISELAEYLENGDIESAKDIASDLNYKPEDICHLDLYDFKETNDFLGGIEAEVDDSFPEEEEKEDET